MARLGWSVPLPGPFRVSGTVGGKRRARGDQGRAAAESFAAAVDRGGARLLERQAAAAERHGGERAVLLERAAAVRAGTGDVYAAAIDERVAHLEAAVDGTVQYMSRSRKLRRLLDDIEGEGARLHPERAIEEATTVELRRDFAAEQRAASKARTDERVAEIKARGAESREASRQQREAAKSSLAATWAAEREKIAATRARAADRRAGR